MILSFLSKTRFSGCSLFLLLSQTLLSKSITLHLDSSINIPNNNHNPKMHVMPLKENIFPEVPLHLKFHHLIELNSLSQKFIFLINFKGYKIVMLDQWLCRCLIFKKLLHLITVSGTKTNLFKITKCSDLQGCLKKIKHLSWIAVEEVTFHHV